MFHANRGRRVLQTSLHDVVSQPGVSGAFYKALKFAAERRDVVGRLKLLLFSK
jgi:hypothetical protein